MKNVFKISVGLLATSMLAACSVTFKNDESATGQYFTGYVYDGVTAQEIKKYKLTLTSNPTDGSPKSIEAEVDEKTGLYTVGPLKPGSDYSIVIDGGDDYRPFRATENGLANLPGGVDQKYTDFVEAYLFPTKYLSPAVSFNLFSENVDQPRPTGQVRFTPINGYDAGDLDLGNVIPSATGTVWFNDLDSHSKTFVTDKLADGVLDLAEGDLVYGVTYRVTVFSVTGHQYDDFFFTAGADGNRSVVLSELNDSDLQLVSINAANGRAIADGTLVLTFNREIELDPSFTEDWYAEEIDNGLVLDSQNTDADANVNSLEPDADSTIRERGTSIEVSGNTITLKWNGMLGTTDDQDTILGITWGNLDSIIIRSKTEENDAASLDNFLPFGATSQFVLMKSEPVIP